MRLMTTEIKEENESKGTSRISGHNDTEKFTDISNPDDKISRRWVSDYVKR